MNKNFKTINVRAEDYTRFRKFISEARLGTVVNAFTVLLDYATVRPAKKSK